MGFEEYSWRLGEILVQNRWVSWDNLEKALVFFEEQRLKSERALNSEIKVVTLCVTAKNLLPQSILKIQKYLSPFKAKGNIPVFYKWINEIERCHASMLLAGIQTASRLTGCQLKACWHDNV